MSRVSSFPELQKHQREGSSFWQTSYSLTTWYPNPPLLTASGEMAFGAHFPDPSLSVSSFGVPRVPVYGTGEVMVTVWTDLRHLLPQELYEEMEHWAGR